MALADAGQTAYLRSIEATDPLGGTVRQEFRWVSTDVPASVAAGEVPAGFAAYNTYLDHYLTFFWDERAMASAPGAASSAVVTKWLASDWRGPAYTNPLSVAIPHSVKRPLEGRVWYGYPDQVDPNATGSGSHPARVGRVLDDGTSQVTETTYTDHGLVTATTDPAGRTTTFTYTAAGQVLTATNAKQETTTYAYDAAGYLQSVTGPVAGAVTSYTYDGYGRMRTVTGPDGYAVTTDYDALDRPTVVTYPDGTTEQTMYDRLDVGQRRDRLGRTTWYVHDAVRRLVATRDPAGRTVTQGWALGGGGCPGCAGRDTLADAKGQTTTWDRDLQGRVLREVRADGVTATLYSYEPQSGRLRTVTDPKGQVTTYTYNLDDTVQQVAYTSAPIATPSVRYTYDPVYSRVVTMVDGTGTTAYTYHPAGSLGAGQVASVDGPLANDTITYTYDELGRVVSRAIDRAANTTTQVYDALGRVTSETNVLGTFSYGYVGVTGRLQLVAYPNGQTSSYAYFDTLGDLRLQTIHHKRPGGATLSKFDYTYDVAGNILTWQQQADSDAPTRWRYGYDRADQLTGAVHETTGALPAPIKRYAYTYDPAGNRTSEQIDDAVTLATHDSLNRLLTHQAGGTLLFKGTLSEPGTVTVNGKPAQVDTSNRFVGGVPVTAGTTTVTINAVDASGNASEAAYEVDQAGTSKTFTYDANGNMTSDGTRTFEWDARNQLVAVTVGTHRSEFSYDGLQRRVRAVEKEDGTVQSDKGVVWCGRDVCEERISGGETSDYFGDGFRRGTQAFFSARDRLGSVHDLTDVAGALGSRVDYDPFGLSTTLIGSAPPRGFTGYVSHPPAGLSLATYRAYDSHLGRWLSEDPRGDLDGPNRCVYARNDPVRLIDLYGLQAMSCEKPTCRPYLHKDIFVSCFLAQVTDPQVLSELVGCVGAGALFGPAAAGACGGLVGWYTSRQCRECATFCDETGPKPCPPGNGPSLGPPPPPGPPPPGPSPNRR